MYKHPKTQAEFVARAGKALTKIAENMPLIIGFSVERNEISLTHYMNDYGYTQTLTFPSLELLENYAGQYK